MVLANENAEANSNGIPTCMHARSDEVVQKDDAARAGECFMAPLHQTS